MTEAGVPPRLETRPWLAILALSAAFLMLGIWAIRDASPTTDEPGHYRYGHRMLRGVAARWDDSKMPISALNALPCFLLERSGSAVRDGDEFAGPCDWTLARTPTLIFALILGLAIASWSRRLYGWPGALVSFGLFAFDPNLLAHGSLVTTDVFGALFVLVSLRAFSRWFERPGLKQTLVLGLSVGGAFISKYTAAYLPVIFLVVALARRLAPREATVGKGRWVAASLVALLIVLAVINVGFLSDETGTSLRDQRFESPQFRELRKIPLVSDLPLPVPRPFVEGLDRVFHRERHGGGSGNIYFLGELRSPGSEGFPAYFLVVFLLKTPIPAVITLVLAMAAFWRHWRGAGLTVDETTLFATIAVFSVYFSFLFRAQIGLRHFLVVIPPLFVLAGSLGPVLMKSRPRIALACVAMALSAASVIHHGTDPLSYFNELVPPTSTYLVAADSNLEWGQSQQAVDAYLVSHPEVLRAPAKPFPGRLIVSANQLTGVVNRKRFEWLRESGLTPTGHVAFTHFLFDVSKDQAARLRAERGDPPLEEP